MHSPAETNAHAAPSSTDRELTFPEGLPGFPDQHRFVLVQLDEYGVVYALRSLEEPGLRLFVVPPAPFYPDYAPEIDDGAVGLLDLHSPDEARILLVLTPGATAAESTVNLLAPIVVNTRSRQAAQVVLAEPDLPLRAPLAA